MATPPRPLFADVGRRTRPAGEERSRAMLLVVALGLLAATAELVREQLTASHVRVVEVGWMPTDAAAAEAQVEKQRAAATAPSPPVESTPAR